MLTQNRGHLVRPLPNHPDAVCAVEFVPLGQRASLRYARVDLVQGSPLGFGPTRMLPGWDAVRCTAPAVEQEHAAAPPAPETLQILRRTAHGAVLECPGHTIEIDRVWHWLARQENLVAERDIEAYATGWWQERDPRGGPHGVVNLAYTTPQLIWGFHHPFGTTSARWMYLDDWPIDIKPLPTSAGTAFWAVEFVRRGQRPTLTVPSLTEAVPHRKIDGVPNRSPGKNVMVLAGGDATHLSPTGRAIVNQPLPVLAGLCGLKHATQIVAFAWDCATWVTDHLEADEVWPAAHQRFWEHLWQSDQRARYLV